MVEGSAGLGGASGGADRRGGGGGDRLGVARHLQAGPAAVSGLPSRQAQAELHCENHLAIVPGATHLFEEPGTLDAAAALARDWFTSHLTRSPHRVS